MTSLLTRLPQDLAFSILKDWTAAWKDIGSLDVALCNKGARPEFLSMIKHDTMDFYDIHNDEDGFAYDKTVDSLARQGSSLVNFLEWIENRGVKLQYVYVLMCQLHTVAAAIEHKAFPSVRQIVFMDHHDHPAPAPPADPEGEPDVQPDDIHYDDQDEGNGGEGSDEDETEWESVDDEDDLDFDHDHEPPAEPHSSVDPADLDRLLACFPQLMEVDCSQWGHARDEHLDVLLRYFYLPLKILNLYSCEEISATKAVEVILAFSASLEEMWCDVLTDACLERIGAQCTSLKFIGIACDHLSFEVLRDFLCGYPDIEEIRLDLLEFIDYAPISDELVAQVASTCTKLIAFEVSDCDGLTIAAFQPLLTHCKAIKTIVLPGFHLEISMEEPKFCDFKVTLTDTNVGLEEIGLLVQMSWLPLRSFIATHDANVYFDAATLKIVAEKHGSTLEELHAALDQEVTEGEMGEVLRLCPQMLGLVLSSAQQLSDSFLERLPQWCPQIISLGLEGANISDDVLVQALKAFSKNVMESLVLDGCARITDAVLPAIVEYSPRLLDLSVGGTGITKEGMIGVLASNARFVPSIGGFSAADTEWIANELRVRGVSSRAMLVPLDR